MPVTTMFEKIKNDFFAILIPGFYILTVSFILFLFLLFDSPSKIDHKKLLEDKTLIWVFLLIFIIFSYLIGQLIRAIRVQKADDWGKFLFYKPVRRLIAKFREPGNASSQSKNRSDEEYSEGFPYRNILVLTALRIEDISITSTPSPKGEEKLRFSVPKESNALHDIFNYWKMTILMESPDAFLYIRELESRVRLFVGMFWSGFCAIIMWTAVALSDFFFHKFFSQWVFYFLGILFLSLLIFFFFFRNIRRLRSQEVVSTIMSYRKIQFDQELKNKIPEQETHAANSPPACTGESETAKAGSLQ